MPEPVVIAEPEPMPEPVAEPAKCEPVAVKAKDPKSWTVPADRRPNRHKLTCECTVCHKAGYVAAGTAPSKPKAPKAKPKAPKAPAPTAGTLDNVTAEQTAAREPKSTHKDRQAPKAKTPRTETKRGDMARDAAPMADGELRELSRQRKADEIRRREFLDAVTDVRDDVRTQVVKLSRCGDVDSLDSLVSDLSDQTADQDSEARKCAEIGDDLGEWGAQQLAAALHKAHQYAMTTLDELLEA